MLDNEKQIKHVVSTYLGFTEDNICIWGWAFVYVWFVDYKENIFWLSDGHSWDSWHLLQSKLGHGFSGFLLTSALLSLSTRFTSLNTRTSVISIMAHKSNVWTKKDNELVYHNCIWVYHTLTVIKCHKILTSWSSIILIPL